MFEFQVNTGSVFTLADDASSSMNKISVGDTVTLCGDKFVVKISKLNNNTLTGIVISSAEESELENGTVVDFHINHIFGVFKGV
jgi:hypothetical protein